MYFYSIRNEHLIFFRTVCAFYAYVCLFVVFFWRTMINSIEMTVNERKMNTHREKCVYLIVNRRRKKRVKNYLTLNALSIHKTGKNDLNTKSEVTYTLIKLAIIYIILCWLNWSACYSNNTNNAMQCICFVQKWMMTCRERERECIVQNYDTNK